MLTRQKTRNKVLGGLFALLLTIVLLCGGALLRTAAAKADVAEEKTDITANVNLADWGTAWNADTTQIMILLNSGTLDDGGYINDNPNKFAVDLCEYIAVSVDGGEERTVRSIITSEGANYSGAKFPMTAGNAFNPILLYAPNGGDHLQFMILKAFADQGHFTVRIKAGFQVSLGGKQCVITDDILFGYASTGSWTQMYDVTFKNGDTVVKTEKVVKGLQPTAPTEVTKASTATTDYTFTGWDKEIAAVNAHTVYSARFTESARKYNVTFAGEDGTPIGEAVPTANGGKIARPSDPVKASNAQYEYTFDGWYTADNKKWNFDTDNMPTSDITLTARFTQSERKYTVTFADENGTPYEDDGYAVQKVSYNATATKPTTDPVKASTATQTFTFDGWYNGETEYDFATPVTEDITLTARFAAQVRKYTVTVTFTGLESAKDDVSLQATYEQVLDLTEYNEQGYGFTATANGAPINGKTYTVTGDVTIAVTYAVGTYTVTFAVEGITVRPAFVPETVSVQDGHQLVFEDYSVIDYSYKLYIGENEVTESAIDITQDITVRVVYTADPPQGSGDDKDPSQDPSDDKKKKGCGSSAAAPVGAAATALFAGVVLLLRKRKAIQKQG